MMNPRGRARSCTFHFKDIEEAMNSSLLHKAHRRVDFDSTVVTETPVVSISVAGRCQGWRKCMEDYSRLTQSPHGTLVLVLDGHRGDQAALLCADKLAQDILENIANFSTAASQSSLGVSCSDARNVHAVEISVHDPAARERSNVFLRAFLDVDMQLFDLQGGEKVFHPQLNETQRKIEDALNESTALPDTADDNTDEPGLLGTYSTLLVSSVNGLNIEGDASMSRQPPVSPGATVAAVLVDATHITVGCLGDCRVFIVERRADRVSKNSREDESSSRVYRSGDNNATTVKSALPAGFRITEASVIHRPTNEEETRRLVTQFGPNVVANGRVLGILMVTRALGDFDIKFNMHAGKQSSGRILCTLGELEPRQALCTPQTRRRENDNAEGEEEEWTSGLLVSNIPRTRVWRRGAIPNTSDNVCSDGDSAAAVVPYDLIAIGSDGTWERQCISNVASRAEEALQPLLRKRSTCSATPQGRQEFILSIEDALRKVVAETLQCGIASVNSPKLLAPGGDNMSLALMLLLK